MFSVPPTRSLSLGGLLVILGAYLAMVMRFQWTSDALWIDLQFGRNMANAVGPRFNEGDPALEAWSSPLGLALATLVEWSGLPPVQTLHVLGAMSGCALLVVLYRSLIRRLQVRPAIALGAVATLGLSPVLAAWSTGLPADVLGVLFLYLAFDRLVLTSDTPSSGVGLGLVAAGLALFARHDGPVWVAAICGLALSWRLAEHRAVHRPLPRSFQPSVRSIVLPASLALLMCVVGTSALIFARTSTFGTLVPWAMQWSGRSVADGVGYVLSTAVGVGLPMLWGLAICFPGARTGGGKPALALLGVAGVLVALSGGETDPFARLLLPAVPFGTVVLARLADQQADVGRRGTAVWIVVLALVVAHRPTWDLPLMPRIIRQAADLRPDKAKTRSEVVHWRFQRDRISDAATVGRVVAEHVPQGHSWTAILPGARGYASGLRILDLSGRVSRVAHARREGELAPRSAFESADLLRARIVDRADVATVLAKDWAAEHSARSIPLENGSFLVLQEALPRPDSVEVPELP